MKAWDWIQEDPIGKELLTSEGGEQEEVGRPVVGEDRREPCRNLSESVPGLEPDLVLLITSTEPTSGLKTKFWSQFYKYRL